MIRFNLKANFVLNKNYFLIILLFVFWLFSTYCYAGKTSLNLDSAPKINSPFLIKQIQDLVRQKRYIEAEKSCTLLLSSDPNNLEARSLRASLNQRIGNTAKATEDYNFLINNKRADGRVFNNLGVIYVKEKKYKEAEELFYKAIQISPERVEFHNNLSELLMEIKDDDRAIEEYEKVIQLEPANVAALFNLGLIYKNKGEFIKAKEQWDKILILNPDDKNAKSALEYLMSKKQ